MNSIRGPAPGGRVMVRMPDEIRQNITARAAQNRRSVSSELLVLIESGLAAEKAASNPTA